MDRITFNSLRHALPKHDVYWFDAEFDKVGSEGAKKFGFSWLQINLLIHHTLGCAGVDVSHPVIRWMCFRIAYAVCTKIKSDDDKREGAEVP